MQYDQDKVDEATLALLFLNFFPDGPITRAWKGFDWESLHRLHDKGFISDPRGRAKSVIVTDEGRKEAEKFFARYFTDSDPDATSTQ